MKRIKRFLALIMAVAILAANMPAPAFAVGADADGYIQIRTIEDLYNIRNDLTAKYILMNDIDLIEATAEGGAWDFDGRGWNPIGSNNVYGDGAFSGEFNGNGHKIIGMRIVIGAPGGAGDTLYGGLFATITGKVCNLSVVDADISGNIYGQDVVAGVLAGKVSGSIQSVSVSGTISMTTQNDHGAFIGGIAGKGVSLTASDCNSHVALNVSASERGYAGGLFALASGTIEKCFSTGEIVAFSEGSSVTASGISGGYSDAKLVIKDSYNTGNITGTTGYNNYYTRRIAGIGYGYSGYLEVASSYNTGHCSAGYAISDQPAENCYYLSGTGSSSTGAAALTEAQMKLSSVFVGFDFETVWTQDNTADYPYPQLLQITDAQLVAEPTKTVYAYGEPLDLSGSAVVLTMENGRVIHTSLEEGTVAGYDPKLAGEQTVDVTIAGRTFSFRVTVQEPVWVPIYTAEDLYNIRYNLDGSYRLMNDIDLTEATAKGGDWDYNGRGWNPIGSNDVYGEGAFSGAFDGNGHKIIGMRMEVASYPAGTGATMYLGLFAKVTGTVTDLTMENAKIDLTLAMDCYIGAVAAVNNGTIADCAVSGELIAHHYAGDSYVGGIVGSNDGMIRYCHSASQNTSCDSTGPTSYTVYHYAGGIAGANHGEIVDSYNTGAINSKFSSNVAGGIAGNNHGAIQTCYNIGAASGSSRYGIAPLNTNGTIMNSYYLSGTGSSSTGATALTDAQMRLEAPFAGFDFTNVWTLNSHAVYPYPQLRSNMQTTQELATLVSIISWPSKQTYYVEDPLELDGCRIRVTYTSGKTEVLDVTQDMISGYDSTLSGEQTVTVTYAGSSDTFPVTVEQWPEIRTMQMVSQPAKTQFVIGTAFDFTGAKCKVTYADGTSQTLDITENMLTGHNINRLGKQTVTVHYFDSTTTFTVQVLPVAVSALRLDAEPQKLTYLEGEKLDLTGMILIAEMNDGTQASVASGYEISGYNGEPGNHTVVLTYAQKNVSFQVAVQAKSVISLRLNKLPVKTAYIAGQPLDLTGMELVAFYDNGQMETVTDYTLSGFDQNPGHKNVQLHFGGKSVTFGVEVEPRVITEFVIASEPAKLQYFQNEAFDSAGLVVRATYNDGVTEEITQYTLTGFSSNPGTHTVSVVYDGFVKSFQVTVIAKELVDLKIQAPDKLTYLPGEAFDPTGMVVTAYYNNGQQIQVTDYAMTGFDSSTQGTKTITVTYGTKSAAFSVSVNPRSQIVTDGRYIVDNLQARLGEEICVPVSVTGNTGIAGLCHTLSFEAEDLEFLGLEVKGDFADGTVILNQEKLDQGQLTLVWFHSSDVKGDGTVYELRFKVRETAADGISKVELTFAANDHGNISGEDVLFDSQNGFVDVRSYWLGDLNCDRKYAMVDLVMLAQYVAKMEMETNEKMLLSADVNEDSVIDIHDVVLLNQWLLTEDF